MRREQSRASGLAAVFSGMMAMLSGSSPVRRRGPRKPKVAGVYRAVRAHAIPEICRYPSVGAWANARGLCKR